jgi:hypothetical protein
MSIRFPRRNDVTNLFVTHRHDDEQDAPFGHPYDLNSLLSIDKARIDILKPVRVFERGDGIPEIDAVMAQIRGCLVIIPLVLHRNTLSE